MSEIINTWDRSTPNDGLLLNSEFENIYNLLNKEIGTIKAFIIDPTNIDDDYIILDGREVLKADYPLLEAKITGIQGFDTTTNVLNIKVPDLRGYFLRYDDTTRNVGSLQNDTIQNITGTLKSGSGVTNNGVFIHPDAQTGCFDVNPAGGSSETKFEATQGGSIEYFREVSFNASRSVRTSSETRPKNVHVIYAIKGR